MKTQAFVGRLVKTDTGRFYVVDGNNQEVSPVLFRYIRNEKNQRVGAVAAVDLFGELRFGYAKYNPDREKSKPDDLFGLKVAVGRALKRNDISYPFALNKGKDYPPGVREHLLRLFHQASNYFETKADYWEEGSYEKYCSNNPINDEEFLAD